MRDGIMRSRIALLALLLLALPLISVPAAPDADEMARLVKQLGDDDFARREAASKRLIEIGELALDALRNAAESDDAEVRRRAGEIVAGIENRLYGEQLRLTGHTNSVTGVVVSADGNRLLTCSTDQTLRLWDAATGKQLRVLEGHNHIVLGAALSTDGKRVLSGSDDQTVRLWDAETGKQLQEVKFDAGPVKCVAFGPEGRVLAGGFNALQVWDLADGKKVRGFAASDSWLLDVAYHRGTKVAATAGMDGKVLLWDLDAEKDARALDVSGSHPAISVCFSPDGKRLLAAVTDGALSVWDTETGKEVKRFHAHNEAAECAAFSPDGKRIVSGGGDGLVCVWDATTGKLLRRYEGHKEKITGVAYFPDGKRIASSSNDRTVRVWGAAK
jgi:WD40 repeat protein